MFRTECQRLVNFGLLPQACVVTEAVSGMNGLAAGKHYSEPDWNHIPNLVDWLLHDLAVITARTVVAERGGEKDTVKVSNGGDTERLFFGDLTARGMSE